MEDHVRYKDYPEGSAGKRHYDSFVLTFEEYLKKYYSNPDLGDFNKWLAKYIDPAFEEQRHEEMAKNFGYVSVEFHDFTTQSKIYGELLDNQTMDESLKKFISFMGGSGFFERYNISVKEWIRINNWSNPDKESEIGRPITEILDHSYGINLIKVNLTILDFWRR